MTCNQMALEPLKAAVVRMAPEIEASCKQRATVVKDFDSYRRRLQKAEAERDTKRDKLSEAKLNELLAEVEKLEGKVSRSEAEYMAQNAKTKSDIIAAKFAHDHLIEIALIATVTTQVIKTQILATQLLLFVGDRLSYL